MARAVHSLLTPYITYVCTLFFRHSHNGIAGASSGAFSFFRCIAQLSLAGVIGSWRAGLPGSWRAGLGGLGCGLPVVFVVVGRL